MHFFTPQRTSMWVCLCNRLKSLLFNQVSNKTVELFVLVHVGVVFSCVFSRGLGGRNLFRLQRAHTHPTATHTSLFYARALRRTRVSVTLLVCSMSNRFEEFSDHGDVPLSPRQLHRAGITVMFLTVVGFNFFVYVTFLSWWQPSLSNRFIDDLRNNNYYILLPPVIVPTILAFAWINWLGMQFFKRN